MFKQKIMSPTDMKPIACRSFSSMEICICVKLNGCELVHSHAIRLWL